MNFKRMTLAGGIAIAVFLSLTVTHADPKNANTDWFSAAKYGVFMHFLPADENGLKLVEKFDTAAVATQLEKAGAGYFVLTLGQNSGYFNSPNETYDRITGYAAGERCSKRDLPMDVYQALEPRGIKLMLYLPCQVPNQDERAQQTFGLRQGKADQPIDPSFVQKWAKVIQEWSTRYGDKVAGWWFDGGYEQPVRFNAQFAQTYAEAVKRGNPKAIVTFNPGVKLIHYKNAEDYTAGELNEPLLVLPESRWLDGSQWHALTFIGSSWGRRDTRYTDEQWAKWVRTVTDKGGVVTLDMGPNYDAAAGAIGTFAEAQLKQLQAIKAAVRTSTKAGNAN